MSLGQKSGLKAHIYLWSRSNTWQEIECMNRDCNPYQGTECNRPVGKLYLRHCLNTLDLCQGPIPRFVLNLSWPVRPLRELPRRGLILKMFWEKLSGTVLGHKNFFLLFWNPWKLWFFFLWIRSHNFIRSDYDDDNSFYYFLMEISGTR